MVPSSPDRGKSVPSEASYEDGIAEISKSFFIYEIRQPDEPVGEDEDSEDRLLYFYPRSIDVVRRANFFGYFEATVHFSTVIFDSSDEEPGLLRLESALFAFVNISGRYGIVISGPSHIPDQMMENMLRDYIQTLIFFFGPLDDQFSRMKQRSNGSIALMRQEVRNMASEIVPILQDSIFNENLLMCLDTLSPTPSLRGCLVAASQMLDSLDYGETNLSATMFVDRSIMCSQLDSTQHLRWLWYRVQSLKKRTSRHRTYMSSYVDEQDDNGFSLPSAPLFTESRELTHAVSHSQSEHTYFSPVWVDESSYQALMKRFEFVTPPSTPSPTLSPTNSSGLDYRTPSVDSHMTRLPEHLAFISDTGRYLGLVVHTVSRISVAVLMPIHLLYDDRHVRLLTNKLPRARLLDLERKLLPHLDAFNPKIPTVSMTSPPHSDSRKVISQWTETDSSSGSSSNTSRELHEEDLTDYSRLSPMACCGTSIPHTVLQIDLADGRCCACGKLCKGFVESAFYSLSNIGPKNGRLFLSNQRGTCYARRFQCRVTVVQLAQNFQSLDRIENKSKEVMELDHHQLLI